MRETFRFDYRPNLLDTRAGLKLGFWGSRSKTLRTLFLLFGLPFLLSGVLIWTMFPPLDVSYFLALSVFAALVWGALFGTMFGA